MAQKHDNLAQDKKKTDLYTGGNGTVGTDSDGDHNHQGRITPGGEMT